MPLQYIAHYHFPIEGLIVLQPAIALAETLADLKDGFWINADLNFTKGSDSQFWIPPHHILFIDKDAES